MTEIASVGIDRPVAVQHWGRDHWSTFAYAESVTVNYQGQLALERMRCDYARHPALVTSRVDMGQQKYPTRLKDSVELRDHDDWDCLLDAQSAGYLELSTGVPDELLAVWTAEYGDMVGEELIHATLDDVLPVVEPGNRGPLAIRAPRKPPSSVTGREELKYPPRVRLTKEGQRVAALLRNHKADGGSFGTFVLAM